MRELHRFACAGRVRFAPGGASRFTAHADGGCCLRDLKTGAITHRFPGLPDSAEEVIFWPDGLRLVSAHGDGSVRGWEVSTGKELFRFDAHRHGVLGAALAPDGKYALSSGRDGTIRLWRLPGYKPTPASVIPATLTSFGAGAPTGHGLAISPDGRYAVSVGGTEFDRPARCASPRTGRGSRSRAERRW